MLTPGTLYVTIVNIGGDYAMHKPYHHGNLEETLIETGIALIDKEGIKNFSLRKVAAACGVSHAAPYKHFADKDVLLQSMWQHVIEKFSDRLEMALKDNANNPKKMILLAQAYLHFFIENPHYYRFLLTQPAVSSINLSNLDETSDYRPFEIFKKEAKLHLEMRSIQKNQRNEVLISMWASVQGVTSLAVMQNVQYEGNWDTFLVNMLKNYTLPRKDNEE